MAEEGKKVSFGFSKLKKQTNLVKSVETSKPEIEYVDSFDGVKGKFSFKGNIRSDRPVKKELVIPLIGTKTALEVIKARLEENRSKNDSKVNESNVDVKPDTENKDKGNVNIIGKDVSESSKLPEESKDLSIDDLAAKEILNDLQNNSANEKVSKTLVIKHSSNKVSKIIEETQIDYENIPVNDFGLAMLRGMGWTPETGIGKEQRVVQVVAPKLRPKGLGLGADSVMLKQPLQDPDLNISIKSYVKFVSGIHKGNYGQVEAMDDDTGRVTVKLALDGMVSVSEVLLIPVSKSDYDRNSKVINPMKYENFKEKSGAQSRQEVDCSSSHSRSKDDKSNRHRKEKYDRRETKLKDEGSDFSDRREKYSSSQSSSSQSPERSKHKKKKRGTRTGSGDRKHKKSKKKGKKKKYSSDSDNSSDRNYKRETSKNHSYHSKSKNSSYR